MGGGDSSGRLLNPRVRAFLDRQFWLIVGIALLLTVTGGWLTYVAYAQPGTHPETRTVGHWETAGAFDHGAKVVRPNGVFPVGSTLENQSVYFTRVSPVLNVSFWFSFDATGSGQLNVSADADLVVRSVTADRREGERAVLWKLDRSLATGETALAPGERYRLPFSVNVSAVRNRSVNVTDRLGIDGGKIETAVVVTVRYEGEALGEPVSRTRTFRLGIDAGDGTYRVPGDAVNRSRHERTRTVQVANDPGPLRSAGGPALAVLGFVGLAVLAVGRWQGIFALTPTERERLAHDAQREEFGEWITAARVPPEALERPRVEVESLEGLVDVAIDTGERVIQHAHGQYYVLHESWLYVYEVPGASVDRASAEMDESSMPKVDAADGTGADSDGTDGATAGSGDADGGGGS